MKKRLMAFIMAFALVVSMAVPGFASEKSDDLSGLMDMLSGIADSVGSQSKKNEEASDSSGIANGLGELFSGIANSAGAEAGDNEQAGDILSGLSDLFSTITGSVNAETEEDVVDEDAASEIAGTLEGVETPATDVVLDTIAGVGVTDPDMEYDTLADWDIMVPVPDDVRAVYDSNGYTLYVTDEDSIPYVRVNSYSGYSDIGELVEDLLAVMEEDHADVEVLAGPEMVEAEGREFCEIIFTYDVQGYPVTDTRVITMVGNRAYMFTAKEVSELELYVGSLLETVALESVFLGEEDIEGEPQELDENELYWGMGLEVIDSEDLEGDFVTFDEIGLMMWLPDFFIPAELPAEVPAPEAFLGYYTTADESAYVSVAYQSADITMDDYIDLLESFGSSIEEADEYVINGIPFIYYEMPAGDSLVLGTVLEGEGLVEFAFAPASEEDMIGYFEVMGVSIQEAE